MNPKPEMNHAGARLAPHSNFFFVGKRNRNTQIPDMNNKMTKNVFLFSSRLLFIPLKIIQKNKEKKGVRHVLSLSLSPIPAPLLLGIFFAALPVMDDVRSFILSIFFDYFYVCVCGSRLDKGAIKKRRKSRTKGCETLRWHQLEDAQCA